MPQMSEVLKQWIYDNSSPAQKFASLVMYRQGPYVVKTKKDFPLNIQHNEAIVVFRFIIHSISLKDMVLVGSKIWSTV